MNDYPIITPSEQQARDYAAITTQAFGGSLDESIEWVFDLGLPAVRVALVDGQVAAGLKAHDMAHYFLGRRVTTWGIGGVAVAPHHRNLGLACRLMVDTLRDARSKGIAVSSLYPATQKLYRKVGYERAGVHTKWKLNIPAIALEQTPGNAIPLTEDHLPTIKQLYTQQAKKHHGWLDRPDHFWTHRIRLDIDFGYLILIDDQPAGYIVFKPRKQGVDELWIQQWCVTSPDAARLSLQLIAQHRSINQTAYWYGTPDEWAPWLLPNDTPELQYQEDWMLRIVDIDAALTQRGYPPITAEFHFDLTDDILPDNAGRRVLTLRQGKPTVQPGGTGRIALDIRALAPLYTGYLSPQHLRDLDRLTGPEEDLTLLAAAFAAPLPAMPDHF